VITLNDGKVGIGTIPYGTGIPSASAPVANPSEILHVFGNIRASDTVKADGYIQLALTAGSPPTEDCDEPSEEGRMKFDSDADLLWICGGVSGWISK
jgi:hypothetical protein